MHWKIGLNNSDNQLFLQVNIFAFESSNCLTSPSWVLSPTLQVMPPTPMHNMEQNTIPAMQGMGIQGQYFSQQQHPN